MRLALLLPAWRAFLPTNREIRPYMAMVIESGDTEALRAITKILSDPSLAEVRREYFHQVTIWDAATEILTTEFDDGGATTRAQQAYALIKRINAWVLGNGASPLDR